MMETANTDDLYKAPQLKVAPFAFNEQVAHVFTNMIERSVPGYQALLQLIASISQSHYQPNTAVYDLGCSLGAVTQVLQATANIANLHFIAIDNSAAMLNQATQHFANQGVHAYSTEFICKDIREVAYQPASVIVVNYCLQFLPIEDRDAILSKLYQALVPGGILILSEKIKNINPADNERLKLTHETFKQQQGYSPIEIQQKREALTSILFPETIAAHTQRLTNIGFNSVQIFFQCLQFVAFFAQK